MACVVENGKKDIDQKLRVDIGSIWKFLKDKNDQVIEFEVTFEISGQRPTRSSVAPIAI